MTSDEIDLLQRLFINYRREDTGQVTSRLLADLAPALGNDRIFYDRESIRGGERWKERLRQEVSRCAVFLALIGKRWLEARNEASKQRRLDEPDDFVRIELEFALATARESTLLIPVLVDGAEMPRREHLPASIQELADRQALPLRTGTRQEWEQDLLALLRLMSDRGLAVGSVTRRLTGAKLTIRKNTPTGEVLFTGDSAIVRLGRDPSSDIVVDQPASWEHGRIVLVGGVYFYQHLGQRPTILRRLNGQTIELSRSGQMEEALRQLDRLELTPSLRVSVQFELPEMSEYTPTD